MNNINEEINRIRLMMGYSSNKTLNENYNSLSKIVINEQGKAVVDTIFKDMATAGKAELKSGIEAAIARSGGVEIKAGGKKIISQDVDEIIRAMEGTTANVTKKGAMDIAGAFVKEGSSPALKEKAANAIASMDAFAVQFGDKSKELIMRDLMKGPGKYSKEEAEMIATKYINNRSALSTDVKATTKASEKAGAEEIGVSSKADAKASSKADAEAAASAEGGSASATGGKGGSAKVEGGSIHNDINIELKVNTEAEAEALLKNAEGKTITRDTSTIEREFKNSESFRNEAKVIAEESPSKFKAWLQKKGILQWAYRWTIGNKWFWILGGGALGYYWWKNWSDNNDIKVDEDPDVVIPEPGGSDERPTDSETANWMNDPNAGDGDPGDPLFGTYKKCKEPYKIGCMTTRAYPLIQKLQACVGVKETGKWGKKTDVAVRNDFGVSTLTDDEIRKNCHILGDL